MAEAISAQERARAAGAVAASGVFSDAAGVGTFASSAAAMARCGGGAERGSAGDIPFPGETRPVCERQTRSLAREGSAGSLSGSLAGGRRPRGRGCGVGARVSRTPRGIRACVDARGRSERPRRPSIGVPERWVSRKQCVTKLHRKSENARLCTFCVRRSSQRCVCVFFRNFRSDGGYTGVQQNIRKSRRPSSPTQAEENSEKEKPRLSKLCWTRLHWF